jgi:hypothetical protein
LRNQEPSINAAYSCINLAHEPLRSGMSAAIRTFHNTADAFFHTACRNIIHRSPKTAFVSLQRLIESNGTAQRSFEGKAFVRSDVIENPLLELDVYLLANFAGNAAKGIRVQVRGTVIGIKPCDIKGGEWKRLLLPLPGGPATMIIRRRVKANRQSRCLPRPACHREGHFSAVALVRR